MDRYLALALAAGALALAGCATADPASRAGATGAASQAAAANEEELSRTGSLLKPKPSASQPVKGIGNAAWRDEHEKAQPMPPAN